MILKDGRTASIELTESGLRYAIKIDGVTVKYANSVENAWEQLDYVELASGDEEVKALCVWGEYFGEWYPLSQAHYVDDLESWIPDCRIVWDYDDRPQLDEDCVEVNLGSMGDQWILRSELDDEWEWCDHCGRYVTNDEYDQSAEMCDDCYEEEYSDCVIGEYHSHSKDTWFVMDDESPYDGKGLGFELEIDGNPESCGDYRGRFNRDFAERLMRDSGLEDNECVFETDSSLDSGFEIISQPHSIRKFWSQRHKFATMLALCAEAGYKSHDAETCGLHVHVSRSLLGSTPRRIKRSLAKIHRFYDNRWDDLLRASRRRKTYYCEKNYDGGLKKDSPLKDWMKTVENGTHCNAINESHWNTVEFRLGRGTLNASSFFAWIDLTLAIVRNSRKSEGNLKDDAQWLDGIEEDTARYLLRRGAFVAEVNRMYPNLDASEVSEEYEEELCA